MTSWFTRYCKRYFKVQINFWIFSLLKCLFVFAFLRERKHRKIHKSIRAFLCWKNYQFYKRKSSYVPISTVLIFCNLWLVLISTFSPMFWDFGFKWWKPVFLALLTRTFSQICSLTLEHVHWHVHKALSFMAKVSCPGFLDYSTLMWKKFVTDSSPTPTKVISFIQHSFDAISHHDIKIVSYFYIIVYRHFQRSSLSCILGRFYH